MTQLDELYAKLQEAVTEGDHDTISRIQKKILNMGRDSSIDESLMRSVSGKTLGKNIKRIIKEDNGFSEMDYAKIVSSLITHAIIESEASGKSLDDFSIKEMYIILGKFINKSEGAVDDIKEFVTERYEEFL